MPSGRRAKKKQQKRNRKRRQLLERSRRSRDDLINSALEETDVVAFVPTPRRVLDRSHHSSFCDVPDGSPLGTPSGDVKKVRGRTLVINSTPRRRISYSPSPSRLRSSFRPTSLMLNPIITVEEVKLCGSSETENAAVQLAGITSSTDKPVKTVSKLTSSNYVKDAILALLNTVSAYFWKFYLSFTTVTITRVHKSDCCNGNAALASKLDQILLSISEMSIKQDKFIEIQENLSQRIAILESKMSSSSSFVPILRPPSGGPPPPPPPPPPMPIFKSAAPLEIVKKPQDQVTDQKKAPSRPNITLEDILGVQLKKTPAVKPFADRTPGKGSGPRGPLVSVDMIRSVKLKPTTMRRRQSLERPLQTPSSIFLHSRSQSMLTESEIENESKT